MKDHVLHRMTELGCAPSLRALVERLPTTTRIVVKAGRAEWLPLAAGDGHVAGVYMNVRHCHLLLTPADAAAVSAETGCRVTKTNRSTGYLHVTADEAADPHHVDALAAALDRAVLRSGTRLGSDSPDDVAVAGGRRPQRVCQETGLEVPASGLCDDHGQECAPAA